MICLAAALLQPGEPPSLSFPWARRMASPMYGFVIRGKRRVATTTSESPGQSPCCRMTWRPKVVTGRPGGGDPSSRAAPLVIDAGNALLLAPGRTHDAFKCQARRRGETPLKTGAGGDAKTEQFRRLPYRRDSLQPPGSAARNRPRH